MEALLKITKPTTVEIEGLNAISITLNQDFKYTKNIANLWQTLIVTKQDFSITLSGYVGIGSSDKTLRRIALSGQATHLEIQIDGSSLSGDFCITNYQFNNDVNDQPTTILTLQSSGLIQSN